MATSVLVVLGGLQQIRTADLSLRRRLLYPTELATHLLTELLPSQKENSITEVFARRCWLG